MTQYLIRDDEGNEYLIGEPPSRKELTEQRTKEKWDRRIDLFVTAIEKLIMIFVTVSYCWCICAAYTERNWYILALLFMFCPVFPLMLMDKLKERELQKARKDG